MASALAPAPRRGALLAALALGALALGGAGSGCAREETSARDTPRSVETSPPANAETEPATAFDGIELPPFEPLPVPPPELEPIQLTPALDESAAAAPALTSPPPPGSEEPVAALEDLLRIPRGTAKSPEAKRGDGVPGGATPGDAAPKASTEQSAIDRWRDRVVIESRSDDIGPKGPRQGKRSETDAGIRVPIDEDVSVEGGVRVDRREEPGLPEAERKSTPRVGVEVRF